MKFSFQTSVTLVGVVMGIVVAIASETPLGAWFGLELNMISFICFTLFSQSNSTKSEIMLKYFLVQTSGSLVFLFDMLMSQWHLSELPVTIAMSLKAGIAPLHFWLPQVSEGLKWEQLMILLSLQKVSPLVILESVSSNTPSNILILLASLSAIVGGIGGLNETSLRKLLAFSSIAHLSWILACMMLKQYLWFYYFAIYILILASLLPLLNLLQITRISELWSPTLGLPHQVSLGVSLFSLMGLPPLMGFVPKLMVMFMVGTSSLSLLMVILITSSVISLFFYLRVAMGAIHLKSAFNSTYNVNDKFYWTAPLVFNLSGILFLMPLAGYFI